MNPSCRVSRLLVGYLKENQTFSSLIYPLLIPSFRGVRPLEKSEQGRGSWEEEACSKGMKNLRTSAWFFFSSHFLRLSHNLLLWNSCYLLIRSPPNPDDNHCYLKQVQIKTSSVTKGVGLRRKISMERGLALLFLFSSICHTKRSKLLISHAHTRKGFN